MKQQIKKLVRYSKVAATLSLSLSAIVFAKPVLALDFNDGTWTKVTIDFDEQFTASDGSLRSLDAGTVVRDQWLDMYGLSVEAKKGNSNSGYAVLFDSDCKQFVNGSCSGGDDDLATGSGNVGGSIVDTEGNVLIIQENTGRSQVADFEDDNGNGRYNRGEQINQFNDPDDNAGGGKLIFNLDLSRFQSIVEEKLGRSIQGLQTRWSSIRFLDIDSNPTAENVNVTVNDEDSKTKTVRTLVDEMYANGANPVLFAGIDSSKEFSDNSVLDVDISKILLNEDAQKLEVDYDGSGAIASISFYYRHEVYKDPSVVPTPAAILPVLIGLSSAAAKRKQQDSVEEA